MFTADMKNLMLRGPMGAGYNLETGKTDFNSLDDTLHPYLANITDRMNDYFYRNGYIGKNGITGSGRREKDEEALRIVYSDYLYSVYTDGKNRGESDSEIPTPKTYEYFRTETEKKFSNAVQGKYEDIDTHIDNESGLEVYIKKAFKRIFENRSGIILNYSNECREEFIRRLDFYREKVMTGKAFSDEFIYLMDAGWSDKLPYRSEGFEKMKKDPAYAERFFSLKDFSAEKKAREILSAAKKKTAETAEKSKKWEKEIAYVDTSFICSQLANRSPQPDAVIVSAIGAMVYQEISRSLQMDTVSRPHFGVDACSLAEDLLLENSKRNLLADELFRRKHEAERTENIFIAENTVGKMKSVTGKFSGRQLELGF